MTDITKEEYIAYLQQLIDSRVLASAPTGFMAGARKEGPVKMDVGDYRIAERSQNDV